MSAPAFAPEGLMWPPVYGSISVQDAPTMVLHMQIPAPAGAPQAEALQAGHPTDTSNTLGGLSLGERVAGVNLVADQDYGVAMHALGVSNGRSGDHQNFERLRGPEPGRAVHTGSLFVADTERVAAAPSVAVPDTMPPHMPPIAAAQRARVLGSFVAGRRLAEGHAADAVTPAAPATGFAGNRDSILNSAFGQRYAAEGTVTAPTPQAPRHAVGMEVRSHRASRLGNFGFRSARLLLDRMVHRAFGGGGRHSAPGRNKLVETGSSHL